MSRQKEKWELLPEQSAISEGDKGERYFIYTIYSVIYLFELFGKLCRRADDPVSVLSDSPDLELIRNAAFWLAGILHLFKIGRAHV